MDGGIDGLNRQRRRLRGARVAGDLLLAPRAPQIHLKVIAHLVLVGQRLILLLRFRRQLGPQIGAFSCLRGNRRLGARTKGFDPVTPWARDLAGRHALLLQLRALLLGEEDERALLPLGLGGKLFGSAARRSGTGATRRPHVDDMTRAAAAERFDDFGDCRGSVDADPVAPIGLGDFVEKCRVRGRRGAVFRQHQKFEVLARRLRVQQLKSSGFRSFRDARIVKILLRISHHEVVALVRAQGSFYSNLL